MCDQREQLIGYLYGECDRDERRAIEAHLRECPTCREEVGGLGAVRQDLLAWDVPPYESVWRPFVAPRTSNPFRDLPAWAMAAAATLVFLSGAGGGAAMHLFWPSSAAAANASASRTPVAGVTPADLASLKASVLAQVRAEMEQRVAAVASHETASTQPATANVPAGAAFDSMSARLASLEDWQNQQILLNWRFDQKIGQIGTRTSSLNTQMAANRQPDGLQVINYAIEGR